MYNKTMKKKNPTHKGIENKPYIEAMREIRRSSAAGTHDNRPKPFAYSQGYQNTGNQGTGLMSKIEKWQGIYWVSVGDGVQRGYRSKFRALVRLYFDV